MLIIEEVYSSIWIKCSHIFLHSLMRCWFEHWIVRTVHLRNTYIALQDEYFDVICSLLEMSRDSPDSSTSWQVICALCAFSLWKGHLSSPAAPEEVIIDRCDHPRLSCLSPLSLQTCRRTHAPLRPMGPCPCFIDFYSNNFLIIPETSLTLLQLSYEEKIFWIS